MAFTIISANKEKTFTDNEFVNICSKEGYDYCLDLGFDFMLTVQYDAVNNKCIVLNQFNNKKFLFKGQPIGAKLEIEKMCKIMVEGSDEFITIKVLEGAGRKTNLASEKLSEDDIKCIYGKEVNAAAKIKIEQRKAEIEEARVAIIKQVSYKINDLKNKISMNSKSGIMLHIGLFLASLISAFGVSNYLTGLPLKEAANVIQMPTNLKLIFIYAFIVYGVGLVLKQGVFLFLQNKNEQSSATSKIAENFMLFISSIFFIAIYIINVLYYIAPQTFPVFAVLISLFFVLTTFTLAVACGYFKFNSVEISEELNKYEYREDFEKVIKEYQQWVERFINTLSNTKINNIKERLFMLQLKGVGETILGILTAPFLAYGVSNTLAMCFPEAAGWIRISGLRLSPIFLVLATCLIIFAFFAFVNAFLCGKKIQASNVLKQDGFSNYLQHGVDFLGLEGIKRLDIEMRRSFTIALAIIFIEFTMNISYFMGEIGGDLGGMFLSCVAALVPTALLIAETYMLSQTKFEIYSSDELVLKIDKD